jgi:hypothetical protein
MLSDVKIHATEGEPSGDAMIYSVALVVEGDVVSYSAIHSPSDRINYSELGRMVRVMRRLGFEPEVIARDINDARISVDHWIDDNFVLNINVA